MKHTLSKLLCFLLTCTFVFALVACAKNGNGNADTSAEVDASAATGEQTESLYDENGYLKDKVPASLNFNNETITILYWSDREHEEFTIEELTGDTVSDALYDRNVAVEQRLGVKLNFIGTKGNASNITNFVSTAENSYKAGDHAYDLVAAHSYTTASVAMKSLLLDLNTCDYLDWSMPWWPETLINESTLGGKLFFASGDISANVIYMMYVTFFNKEMIENRGLENPYDLVKNDQWTIDKMFELSSGIYEDSNGNGKADIGDTYGQYAYTLHLDAFLTGSGIRIIDTSGDNLKIDDSFLSEKAENLTKKVSTFFADHSQAYLLTENSTVHQHFSAGHSLFWNDRCRNAITFKEKDVSFGIVPIPKYDENQTKYSTVLGNPFSLYGIMVDCVDTDRAAAVMECYASESYRKVSPALYEITMKYRFTDDATSAQMFDLARSTVIFDLGRIFSSSLGSPCAKWEGAITNKTSWVIQAKALAKVWDKQVADVNALFE